MNAVVRHPVLLLLCPGEPSQRYARALLDRELSALLLVEAMLAAEADEAGRARNAAEEALRKHRVGCGVPCTAFSMHFLQQAWLCLSICWWGAHAWHACADGERGGRRVW